MASEGCHTGGGTSLNAGSGTRGDTPTPTLPRKRERESNPFATASGSNLITLHWKRLPVSRQEDAVSRLRGAMRPDCA